MARFDGQGKCKEIKAISLGLRRKLLLLKGSAGLKRSLCNTLQWEGWPEGNTTPLSWKKIPIYLKGKKARANGFLCSLNTTARKSASLGPGENRYSYGLRIWSPSSESDRESLAVACMVLVLEAWSMQD